MQQITKSWGVEKFNGYWWVCFGDAEMYSYSGHYPTKRRAKKEITHYIMRGLSLGPFIGAYKHMKIMDRNP